MNLLKACAIKTMGKDLEKGDNSPLKNRPPERHKDSMSNSERGSKRQWHGIGEWTCQMPRNNNICE